MNKTETKPGSRLVLFDFDGTLTRGDSLGAFLWYAVPFGALLAGCFRLFFRLPVLLFTGKSSFAESAKASILETFFAGKSRDELHRLGAVFYRDRMSGMLRPSVLELLRGYRDAGDTVALVSASVDVWLRPFCEAERIALICTELGYEQGVFRGQFSTGNCNRAEKARRIREAFDLPRYGKIIAYGNSAGDAAMVALAQEAWLVEPNGQMKKWPGKV